MTNDDKIKDKKLQYDNRGSAKILALSSGKIDKYEYLLQAKKFCHLLKVE